MTSGFLYVILILCPIVPDGLHLKYEEAKIEETVTTQDMTFKEILASGSRTALHRGVVTNELTSEAK